MNQKQFPIGSATIKEDFYADDLLTGADSLTSLQQKRSEVVNILKTAGLQLTKWNSNHSTFLQDSVDEISINIAEEPYTKTLSMTWKPSTDNFCYQYKLPDLETAIKRSVLSIVARIYDILGLLSPIVIRCKILLQETWVKQLAWDDPLPPDLNTVWLTIKDDLVHMNNIKLNRYVHTSDSNSCEVHGFADASQRAYGCCIYIRARQNEKVITTLLIAKSKVAPIKAQSLPRLELCAALLLTRTWQKIRHKLTPITSKTTFWTDSQIVLQWMKMHSSSLTCFAANRISEIQENTQGISWRHVPTKCNPADIVSRGCSAQQLPSTIWFSGPEFLLKDSAEWPAIPAKINPYSEEVTKECRKSCVLKCSNSRNTGTIINIIIEKNSSYIKILRVLSYVWRVFNKLPCNNILKPADILHIPHDALDTTFWKIVAAIQMECFSEEIKHLSNNRAVSKDLQNLSPFLDEVQVYDRKIWILRVGGRLSKAPMPYDARFPALLPKQSFYISLHIFSYKHINRFTYLYIEFLHKKYLHAGSKVLIGILRQKVWIVNVRQIVRKVVSSCVHCFHYKPKLMKQIMGDLPANRLKAQRPFLVSGVDFCGPFYTSYRIRGKPPYKTYLAVFVCFSSKAVHIETVSDLSSDNFLLCLKRFIGRRGIPQRLYCDNATNFVGAQSKLKELQEKWEEAASSAINFSARTGFQFVFIPPRAPHFGGLWEAAVKSTKTLLVKNISHANLTLEELQTVAVEVEAILNSRPIAPVSDDPADGEALTPAHFLIGTSLLATPDEKFDCSRTPYLSRWQRITFFKQHFWEMWQRDYILSLQQRSKWLQPDTHIAVGQLVLIHDDNMPPQQWLLGRIVQTISGKDGKIRVVDLKTKRGLLRRPIHKLAPLPSDEFER